MDFSLEDKRCGHHRSKPDVTWRDGRDSALCSIFFRLYSRFWTISSLMRTDNIADSRPQANTNRITEHAEVNIRLYRELDRQRWDRYATESDEATCYHLIAWKDIIEKSFGHKTFYILAEDCEQTIRGILPLVRLKSFFFGHFMVSLPFFNYGGICADDDNIRDRLLQKAVQLSQEDGATHIELRHTSALDGLQAKTAKVSMRLGLPHRNEELWDSFSPKLRSQIRRPSKEGMYTNIGREEELQSFYTVFSNNMRDLGTPVYSKEFFRNIMKEFPTAWICTVYTRTGRAVASGFLVGFKGILEIPWASSLQQYNRYSPNMLLYWSALMFACEKGFSTFDFGRSTHGEGTYKFKEQWGAKPVQLYWHYWLKNGQALPELNPRNTKYRMAIYCWKKLPLSLTKLIGPTIVKNLP
jgi:serine/alanine adding enzyme